MKRLWNSLLIILALGGAALFLLRVDPEKAILMLAGVCIFTFFVALILLWDTVADNRLVRHCTEKTEGTLVNRTISHSSRHAPITMYEFTYEVRGTLMRAMQTGDHCESINQATPLQTKVTLWYDPLHPKHILIAEDPAELSVRSVTHGFLFYDLVILLVCATLLLIDRNELIAVAFEMERFFHRLFHEIPFFH